MEIIAESLDLHKLFDFRNSLSLVDRMQYCITIKKDGYYLKINDERKI